MIEGPLRFDELGKKVRKTDTGKAGEGQLSDECRVEVVRPTTKPRNSGFAERECEMGKCIVKV